MELSIVIPIYRLAKNALQELPAAIDVLRKRYTSFEVLFIIDNDVYTDEVKRLWQLQDAFPEVRVQPLKRNYGQHFATLCGFYLAKGDFIMSVDEDMTKYISTVCDNHEYSQYDVYFWHYNKNEMYTSVIRKIFSILFKALVHRIINFKKNSTFRVISKALRDKIMRDKHIYWNIDVMIFNETENIGGCDLDKFDVKDFDSGYNYKTLINVAFEIVYEHNTIFMNLILAVVPAILCFLFTGNCRITAVIYGISTVLLVLFFLLLKRRTPDTTDKIQQAL